MAMTKVSTLNLTLQAHQKLMYYSFRPELYYDNLCEVQSTNLTTRGATVYFHKTADLAAATATLSESVDITPVAMSDTYVSVSLAEYGNGVQTSAQLRATTFLEVNPIVANVLGYNAGISIDTVAANVFAGGTNKVFAQGGSTAPASRADIEVTDILKGDKVRYVVAKLRGANVPTYNGLYKGFIHPDVSYDFRGVSGGTNWSDPHVYSDPSGIYNGVIGAFQGVQFMETPRAPLFSNASDGSGSASSGPIDVYGTLIVGRQAFAKGYSTGGDYGPDPRFVMAPETDFLRRFQGMGWKHFVGYKIFREEALWRIESASSIGANSS